MERERQRALEEYRLDQLVYWIRWAPHAKPPGRDQPEAPPILKRRRRRGRVARVDS